MILHRPSLALLARFGVGLCALASTSCSSCDGDAADRMQHAGRSLQSAANGVLDRVGDPAPEEPSPPPPMRTDNHARLLINGEASFLERMRLIDSAERSIYIQALIFKADTAGAAIADRLIERKRERPELDIRVIVDAYANIQDYDAQMLYFELMDAGIQVQGYEPLYLEWINEINVEDWTAGNKRYHEKYFVVDGERAIVGGMNIADEYARIGSDPALIWRDQDVLLEGPVVRDIESAFSENFGYFESIQARRPAPLASDSYWRAWRHVHPELRDRVTASLREDRPWSRHPVPPFDAADLRRRQIVTTGHDDVRVQFIRSRPRVGERWIEQAYLSRVAAAQTSVVIANAYFIPSPGLRAALIDAARRGVSVTVITNSKETNDIPAINDAGRIAYAPLMEAGVHVYEWHAERHGEGTVHAKFGVFDSEVAIIGSYNLDPRSLALNSEDVVVIEDARIAAELHDHVMEHDLAFAERIDAAQAAAWSDPALLPPLDRVPNVPWWDPRFDPDRFELFLIGQASRVL